MIPATVNFSYEFLTGETLSGQITGLVNTESSDTQLDQQHARLRLVLKFPRDFVLHCLRHTFGTRLGEAGADAFTIMKLMGHSTVTVSQRYVHPSPEALELAYERMMNLHLHRVATVSATLAGVIPDVPQ